jgi:hypothetical protein
MKFIKSMWLNFHKLIHKYQTREQKLGRITKLLTEEKQKFIEILPEQFRDEFDKVSFIAGGCIYSIYNDQSPKDYDFFLNSESLGDKMSEYFMDQCGHHGSNMSGGMYGKNQLIVTNNAISIGKYQIITRFKGTPEEVTEQFDFAHNQCFHHNGEIGTTSDIKYLSSKELVYNTERARDIVGTIMRVNRFVRRGMRISQQEMSKMLLKLHEVGFNERELETLRDASSDRHFSS